MIKKWLSNARYSSLMQSLMPAILAAVLSYGYGQYSILSALLAIIGVCAAHLSMNLLDDYFDYKADMHKDREQVVRRGIKAYTAKYPYLTDGSTTLRELRMAIAVFSLVALACGAVLTVQRGWYILIPALLAGILGFFYSAPPIKFCYWGMGEIIIGIIFGPLLMLGTCWAATGTNNCSILSFAVPVGLLVINILYTHSFIDLEGDQASDKLTLAGLLRYPKAKLTMSFILNFLPFIIVIAAAMLGRCHWANVAVVLLLPRSCWLFWSLIQFQRQADFSAELKQPRKWLGPMVPNWEGVRQMGLDWFLIRWLTARNIVSGFCLILIIIRIIRIIF